MFKEIRGYAIGFVFGHVGIQVVYIDYLICVRVSSLKEHLPSGVISQYVWNWLARLMLYSPTMVWKSVYETETVYTHCLRSDNTHILSTRQIQYNDTMSFCKYYIGYTISK